jgi:hypothetical protein
MCVVVDVGDPFVILDIDDVRVQKSRFSCCGGSQTDLQRLCSGYFDNVTGDSTAVDLVLLILARLAVGL